MSKFSCLFVIALVLSFTLSYAARPNPVKSDSLVESQPKDVEVGMMELDESCEGIGEDECLMRRALAAHTDYIYTQDTNSKP